MLLLGTGVSPGNAFQLPRMITIQRVPAQRQSSAGSGGRVVAFPFLLFAVATGKQEERPKNPRKDNTGFSYVEGMDFASTNEEIEAMGGDPFFLDPVVTTTTTTNAITDPLSVPVVAPTGSTVGDTAATSNNSGAVSDDDSGDGKEQPSFVWDGVEIEDAYFDE
jgi:hypothetical protein